MRTRRAGEVFVLLAVLCVAAFYRFFELPSLPPGLNPDEAMNGNDALASLSTGRFAVFYPENYGREGLFLWLVALSLKLFGLSAQALRYPSAVIGTLTVGALYLLASEVAGRRVAVLASLLTAVSFWHVNFSRMGLRAILVPLLASLAFGLLFLGLRTRRMLLVLLAGGCFGLGVYSYIAFRALFLVLAATLLLLPRGSWAACAGPRAGVPRPPRRWPLPAFLIVIGVVSLPLLAYAVGQPEAFASRTRHVSVLAAEDPPRALWQSTVSTAGMFFVAGDRNPRHSHRQAPVLPPTLSLFFALGLALAIKRTATERDAGGQGEAPRLLGRRGAAAFLLVWLAVMALPAVLTGRGVPHALRSIGMLPAVFILVALGVACGAEALGRVHRSLGLALTVGVVAIAAAGEFRAYFVDWARDPLVGEIFREDLVEKAAYLRTLSPASTAFVIANGRGLPVPYPDGLPLPAQDLLFLLHDECARPAPAIACPVFVRPEEVDALKVDPSRRNVFVLLRDDGPEAARLSRKLAGGVWTPLPHSAVYVWPR
jgi:4-amino-4-deoxy-L-arabinose transferase-like glycosyltransferase